MKKINKEYLALGGLIAVTLLSGAALSSIRVSADDSVVDDISITVPVSCFLSGTGNDSHNATIPNGIYSGNYSDTTSGVDYTNGIGATTLKAYCNDNNGFAIYAAGYTGNEIGGENSNKLVGTTAGIGNIATGTATSGNTSNWAMKLTATSGTYTPIIAGSTSDTEKETGDTDFSNYAAVPNEYVRVAYKNSGTDSGTSAEGATLTTTYAVYISQTQPAGTYAGQVIYTLVHPASAAAPGSTLIMQEVANWKDTLNTGDEVEAIDIRDNKTYTVAKLADGNLWMTQNLDLDIDSTKTYTPADTDVAANWKPSLSTYTTGTTTWTNSTTTPESYDPGELYWNGVAGYYSSESDCTNAGGTWDSTNDLCNQISTTGDSHYHLGNYYNWSAAVAMNDTSEITTNGTLLQQSICPAGWTLPRSGTNSGNELFSEDTFKALWDEYGFTSSSFTDTNSNNKHDEGENALWTSPLYFAASGYWYGVLDNVGGDGYFWSPVVYNGSHAWYAFFSTDGRLYPSDYDGRRLGYPVRCVARPVVSAN